MNFWGKHFLIDGRAGNLSKVQDKANIKKFVDDLVVKIDMVPFGETWIERFATHDPIKSGISFFQMIETSNISGHLVDIDGDFYIDIFSCKEFDQAEVIKLVMDYFEPESYGTKLVYRDAKLQPERILTEKSDF